MRKNRWNGWNGWNGWAGAILVGVLWAAGPAAAAYANRYDGRDDQGGYSYGGYDDGRGYDGYNDGRDCDWEGSCGHQEYRHDYSNHDRNRNRDRDRGAFSPGPFDRSPVTIIICPPGTVNCGTGGGQGGDQGGGGGGQGDQPQPGERPRAAQPNPACIIAVPYHCDPAPTR